MFVKCKYLDPDGFLECNTDLNNCSKCEFKCNRTDFQKSVHAELSKFKQTTTTDEKAREWFFITSGIIVIYCILFGMIFK
jgi:hypothetical protein